MEGTLQVIIMHNAQAELHSTMWTAVHGTANLSSFIPPKDQLLPHAGYAYRFLLNFL
jgi:hypothetical protein